MLDSNTNLNEYDLSIIIPHYNTPDLLMKLLKTIPQKENIQVIVIDDRSDDNLEELARCEKYCLHSNYIFRINNGKKGAGTCRNAGLELASGKWILFADADDYFDVDMYSKVSRYFESEYDIVYFVPTSIHPDTGLLGGRHLDIERVTKKYLQNPNLYNELQLRYTCNVPWTKLSRRECIKKNHIRFDEVRVANDTMFAIKIGFFGKNITASEDTIYVITRTKNSLSSKIDIDSYNIRLEVFIRKYNFLKENLSQKEFKILHMTGQGRIFTAVQNRYTISQIYSIYRKLKKNGIRVIDGKMFNPFYTIPLVKEAVIARKASKEYLSK